MDRPKKYIAISKIALSLLVGSAFPAIAGEVIATVTQASGPLLVKRQNGTISALSVGSNVELGDLIVSERSTLADIKSLNGVTITLQANSQLRVESSLFNVGKVVSGSPSTQQAQVQQTPSSVRAVSPGTPQIQAQKPSLSLPAGSAGVQPVKNSTVVGGATLPNLGGIAPGLYVSVVDGLINLTNKGGNQQFSAGQFGFTASVTQPPVIVPKNPGIQFTPPPVFSSSTGPQSSASGDSKSKGVDCEVR